MEEKDVMVRYKAFLCSLPGSPSWVSLEMAAGSLYWQEGMSRAPSKVHQVSDIC